MSYTMNEGQRRHLQSHTVTFVNDMMEIKAVSDYLLGKHILTKGMHEELLAEKTRGDQARYIHNLVPKRGPKAFDAYYLALYSSGNYPLAHLLEDHLSNPKLKMQSPGVELDPVNPFLRGSGDSSVISGGAMGDPRFPHQTDIKGTYVTSPVDDQDETDLPPVWPDLSRSFLDVNVKICDTNSLTHIQMRKKFMDDSAYSMKKRPRGRMVIINNEKFDVPKERKLSLSDREGTDADATAIDLLFQKLGFEDNIGTYTNLTGQEIVDTLRREASERRRTDDCFVCVVLSHGTMGSVYGTDGQKATITQITDCFDGQNCPKLAGKPKLFFIQACQGDIKDSGRASSVTDLAEQFQNLHVDTEVTDSSVDLPIKADILVATATTPGFVSWRNTQRGSWFIQALVYVLENLAHKYDILTLLTRVNNLVAQNSTSKQGCKQVSEKKDTLTKDFYFFPGLYEVSNSKSS